MAELSTDKRNALDDSSFALPQQRKLPLDTASRVRNALARFGSLTDVSDADKAAAKTRIRAAAKKYGIEVSNDLSEWARFAEPLLVAGPGLPIMRKSGVEVQAGEVVRLPFVKVGEWNFRDSYGPVSVTDDDLDTIVSNFQVGARRQDIPLMVNEEHTELPPDADPQNYVGPGAVGWFKNMERQGDTVFVDVELNRLGEQIYRDDRYRGVSPELLLNWTDPETDQAWGKTAAGLAFTTMPRMKGLAKQGTPLYARERILAFAEPMFKAADDPGLDNATGDDELDVRDFKACPDCDGTGQQNGQDCPTCKGTGQVDSDYNPVDPADEPAAFADLNSVHIDGPMKNLSVAIVPGKLSTARPSVVTGNAAGDGPPDLVGDVYAFPEQKRLPLNSGAGVKGAMARFMAVDAAEAEREIAWTRVITAGQHYGVKVPPSWRDLKASECARWLMQEGYTDEGALHGDAYQQVVDGLKALIKQETDEGEPDDINALSDIWQSLSDWWRNELTEYRPAPTAQPVLDLAMRETRATPDLPESPTNLMKEGAVTMDSVTPTPAPDAVEPAPVPAPAPAPAPEKVNAGEKALMAELSETKALLSVERTGRLQAQRDIEARDATIASLKDANRKRETADKMVKFTERIDALVKTGRITPAMRDTYAEHVAAFAEDSNAEVMLKGLELLPANSAVDLRERGTSKEPPSGQTEGARLEIAAHALMSEKGQPTDTKSKDYLVNYKAALIQVSGAGFQG